jgi:phosphomannomutase
LRPSGNAPELRCYVETNSQEKSDNLVKQVLSSIGKIVL